MYITGLVSLFFHEFFSLLHELGVYLEDLLDKNNQIKSYEAKKEQAEHSLWQAKSKYMPRVDASAQAGKETIAREVGEYSNKDRSYVNVKSTQLVTDFGKTTAGIARARGLMRQAELQLNLVRKQVLLEGITAYLQVLQAREQLHYAKKSEKNIREQTGMEETLVRKGAGLSSDVLQVKAQLSGAMALRVRAEGDLETALSRFQAVFHTVLD
ncbi:MAG: TolC family protein, partial [Desulfovibrionales bacterium]